MHLKENDGDNDDIIVITYTANELQSSHRRVAPIDSDRQNPHHPRSQWTNKISKVGGGVLIFRYINEGKYLDHRNQTDL